MNKKLVASLVATMAVGATAFAANPFVDVPSGQLGIQFRSRIG